MTPTERFVGLVADAQTLLHHPTTPRALIAAAVACYMLLVLWIVLHAVANADRRGAGGGRK